MRRSLAIGLALVALLSFVALAVVTTAQCAGLPWGGLDTVVSENDASVRGDAVARSSRLVDADDDPGIRHSRLQLTWGLIATLWSWIVLAALLLSGLSPRLRDAAAKLAGNRLGSVIPYVVVLTVVTTILDWPLAFYRGFVIEHEFGLSNQTVWTWLEDSAKGLSLAVVSNLVVFGTVYLFIRRCPRRWWLCFSSLVIVVAIIGTAVYPLIIAPLFNEFQPLGDEDLKHQVLSLADSADVEVADVLQMDMSRQTKAANAYFTGIGPTQRIVVADTLLANFSDREILTVVGHEMGHQVHNDLWRALGVAAVLLCLAGYVLYRASGVTVSRFAGRLGFKDVADSASLPLLVLLVAVLIFIGGPIVNTFSRYCEHQADAYTLELTGDNEAYANALTKFGRVNLSDPDPPRWVEILFYTHPSLKRRIDFARAYRRPGQLSVVNPWQAVDAVPSVDWCFSGKRGDVQLPTVRMASELPSHYR